MKAGTTSIWSALRQVSDIHVSFEKEPDVLSSSSYSPDSAKESYRQIFADARPSQLLGECSTSYTKYGLAEVSASRARNLCGPDLRIVYSVRNPVERMTSHFKHLSDVGKSSPRLSEALVEGHGLVENSLYSERIEPWREAFGEGNILIVDFASLNTPSRSSSYQQIARHCGSAESPEFEARQLNSASSFKPREGSFLYRLARNDLYQGIRRRVPDSLRRAALEKAGSLDRRLAPLEPPEIRLAANQVDEIVKRFTQDCHRLVEQYGLQLDWDIQGSAVSLGVD